MLLACHSTIFYSIYMTRFKLTFSDKVQSVLCQIYFSYQNHKTRCIIDSQCKNYVQIMENHLEINCFVSICCDIL